MKVIASIAAIGSATFAAVIGLRPAETEPTEPRLVPPQAESTEPTVDLAPLVSSEVRTEETTSAQSTQETIQRSVREHVLSMSPHLLERFEKAAQKAGVDIDREIKLPDWESVSHKAYDDFVADAEQIAAWEVDFLGVIPSDGIVTDQFLEESFGQLLGKSSKDIETIRATAQTALDDQFVELRASTAAVANQISLAQQQIWSERSYQVTPLIGLAPDRDGRHPVLVNSSGAGGWAVTWTVYDNMIYGASSS